VIAGVLRYARLLAAVLCFPRDLDEMPQGGVDGFGVGEDAGDVAIEDDGGGAVRFGAAAGCAGLAGGQAGDGQLLVGVGESDGGAKELVDALAVRLGLSARQHPVAQGGRLIGKPVSHIPVKVIRVAAQRALIGMGDGVVTAASALSDEMGGLHAQFGNGQRAALAAQALDAGQDSQKVFNPLVRWHGIIIRSRCRAATERRQLHFPLRCAAGPWPARGGEAQAEAARRYDRDKGLPRGGG